MKLKIQIMQNYMIGREELKWSSLATEGRLGYTSGIHVNQYDTFWNDPI